MLQTKKEASNPRKVTDFLILESDDLVPEDYQASCFVLQIYKKSVKTHAIFYFPHAILLTPSVARKTSNGKKKTIH